MSLTVSKDQLKRMYTVEGMSDSQIAKEFNCDRTTILYLRQRYGIKTKLRTGRLGELLVIDELNQRFGKNNVMDMNEADATSLFDILLKDDIRIEVKSSRRSIDNKFVFAYSNKKEQGHLVDENTIRLPSGRTLKLLEKSCDYVVLVFIDYEKTDFLILPSNAPGMFNKSSKSYGGRKLNEVSKHFNNWGLLEGGSAWAKYLSIKKTPSAKGVMEKLSN